MLFFFFFFFQAEDGIRDADVTGVQTCAFRSVGLSEREPLLSHAAQQGRRLELRDLERSEEHTSELQSRPHLVCRLLLEKKKKKKKNEQKKKKKKKNKKKKR